MKKGGFLKRQVTKGFYAFSTVIEGRPESLDASGIRDNCQAITGQMTNHSHLRKKLKLRPERLKKHPERFVNEGMIGFDEIFGSSNFNILEVIKIVQRIKNACEKNCTELFSNLYFKITFQYRFCLKEIAIKRVRLFS